MKFAIASFSVALLAAPVWAGHFESNPDLQQSILNVHQSQHPIWPESYSGMSGGVGTTEGTGSTDSDRTREMEPVLGDPDSGTRVAPTPGDDSSIR
jgi:hypothetical protein